MSNGNGYSMKCACGGDLYTVVDSRPRKHKDFGQIIARRRKCSVCGERTSTLEIREDVVDKIHHDVAKGLLTKLLEDFL